MNPTFSYRGHRPLTPTVGLLPDSRSSQTMSPFCVPVSGIGLFMATSGDVRCLISDGHRFTRNRKSAASSPGVVSNNPVWGLTGRPDTAWTLRGRFVCFKQLELWMWSSITYSKQLVVVNVIFAHIQYTARVVNVILAHIQKTAHSGKSDPRSHIVNRSSGECDPRS